MTEIDRIAAEIARLGLARADALEAQAARMRELLADSDYLRRRAAAQLADKANAYWWEDPARDERGIRAVRAGQTASYASGEGLTTYRFAIVAASGAEFRRAFAQHVGCEFVNVAVPYEPLRRLCERRWTRGAPAGGRSILIREHANYA